MSLYPPAPHPFFGPLTRAEWTRLHCIHCAHHLSFALPPGGEGGVERPAKPRAARGTTSA